MRDRIIRWGSAKEWVELRDIFDLPSFLYLGNFFAGDDLGDLVVRLSEEDREVALEVKGAKRWSAGSLRESSYVRIPAAAVESDEALHGWLEKALAYVETLPPKDRLVTKEAKVPDFLQEAPAKDES